MMVTGTVILLAIWMLLAALPPVAAKAHIWKFYTFVFFSFLGITGFSGSYFECRNIDKKSVVIFMGLCFQIIMYMQPSILLSVNFYTIYHMGNAVTHFLTALTISHKAHYCITIVGIVCSMVLPLIYMATEISLTAPYVTDWSVAVTCPLLPFENKTESCPYYVFYGVKSVFSMVQYYINYFLVGSTVVTTLQIALSVRKIEQTLINIAATFTNPQLNPLPAPITQLLPPSQFRNLMDFVADYNDLIGWQLLLFFMYATSSAIGILLRAFQEESTPNADFVLPAANVFGILFIFIVCIYCESKVKSLKKQVKNVLQSEDHMTHQELRDACENLQKEFVGFLHPCDGVIYGTLLPMTLKSLFGTLFGAALTYLWVILPAIDFDTGIALVRSDLANLTRLLKVRLREHQEL
ncbi:uncharacterized protein LOC129592475 [Paramacrobiotus metropolitanus]|uniref:uncharacterized protein LOC129592475 n=1 Tax=Paramacrobiotus metropolitanus TaxID=2943436 RepID=UPI00244566BA|nr:uncharacterized protein LOC129592475 [Paramacrobiotus metropolitanus]